MYVARPGRPPSPRASTAGNGSCLPLKPIDRGTKGKYKGGLLAVDFAGAPSLGSSAASLPARAKELRQLRQLSRTVP